MSPLTLDLRSVVVDLAVKWVKDGALPAFSLAGRTDEGLSLWTEDVTKKLLLSPADFGDHGVALDLAGRSITGPRVEELAKALQGDTTLTGLLLSGCCINDEDAKLLTQALLSNARLETLAASHNSINDASCNGFARLLERNTPLRVLDLAHNHISSSGVASLSFALKKNDFLQELDLSFNRVDDQGAIWLAAALDVNPHVLAVLDLSGNCISEKGAKRLTVSFEKNTVLQIVSFGATRLARDGTGQASSRSEEFVVRCSGDGAEILASRPKPPDQVARPALQGDDEGDGDFELQLYM